MTGLTGLATALALVVLSLPAVAQEDWRPCAPEGGSCRFSGEALVRFGIEGRYAFRTARDQQACATAAFGHDPAPGQRKQCDVSTNWRTQSGYQGWRDPASGSTAPGGWRFCAVEGGECVLTAVGRVRFGADGRFALREAPAGRLACTTAAFGDPAPNVAKVCEIDEGASAWVLCANEGDSCRVPTATTVRYGAQGRYAEKAARTTIACNNSQFGDPAPGIAKQCEYRGAAAAAGLPWLACAKEGASCSFSGPGMLRYGAEGRWAYREANNGSACSNAAFGGDPAPGQPKQCEMLRIGR